MVGSILSEENYSEVIIDRKKWFIFIAILLRSIDSGVKSYPFWSGFLFRSNKWREKVTRFDSLFYSFWSVLLLRSKNWREKVTRFDPFFYSFWSNILLKNKIGSRWAAKSDQNELQNRSIWAATETHVDAKKYSFWAEIASHLRTLFFDPFFFIKMSRVCLSVFIWV